MARAAEGMEGKESGEARGGPRARVLEWMRAAVAASNWQPGGKPKVAEARVIGKSMERARLCKELVRREMTESRSKSIGRPKIVLTVTSAPKAKERVIGELHYASWEDSRYSKGERTMKVKVKSCC
jgi:hypothetical protein